MSVIDFALARQQLDNKAAARSGMAFCGPCYDATGLVEFLVPHKVWGGDVGHSCPECGSEF